MPESSVLPAQQRSWAPWMRITGLSRLLARGENTSVIPTLPSAELPVATVPEEGFAVGQVTMTVGGSMRPADHPKAVHPYRDKRVATAALTSEETDPAIARHLVEVLQATAAVLSGGNPDGLVRPFVLPNSTQSARLLTDVLARRLVNGERRPDVVIGHGTIGGIFAANITQGLIEGKCQAEFLPIERNFRTTGEGYNFLCPEPEIRGILQGNRIVLAIPILSDQHVGEILEVKRLIDAEQCAAQMVGIVTLIQYGALPPTMAELKVEALLTIGR